MDVSSAQANVNRNRPNNRLNVELNANEQPIVEAEQLQLNNHREEIEEHLIRIGVAVKDFK